MGIVGNWSMGGAYHSHSNINIALGQLNKHFVLVGFIMLPMEPLAY